MLISQKGYYFLDLLFVAVPNCLWNAKIRSGQIIEWKIFLALVYAKYWYEESDSVANFLIFRNFERFYIHR